MDWIDQIPACFGCDDIKFGVGVHDAERVKALVVSARNAGVTWKEFCDALREYMVKKGCSVQEINIELDQVADKIIENIW